MTSRKLGARGFWLAAAAIIVAAFVLVAVRILLTGGTFGDPDRSRFLTVYSLVMDGSYAVGSRIPQGEGGYLDIGLIAQSPTVDVVLDPEALQFYSSKPPLLPTVVAAETWLLERALGWRFDSDGPAIIRVVLLTFNALPFLAYLLLLAWWLSRAPRSRAAALYVLALAAFGTFVTTFTSALNNHTLAAFAALGASVTTLVIFEQKRGPLAAWVGAGLFAGACFTQEMPALTLVAACGFLLFTVDRLRSAVFFLPAALLPALAFLGANTAALGNPLFFFQVPGAWYHFEGSYWLTPSGLDAGERSLALYAFHLLVGHHGLFSLTPAFLPALVELWRPLRRSLGARARALLAAALLAVLVLLPAVLKKVFDLPDELAVFSLLALGAAPLLLPVGWWRDDEQRHEALPRLCAACALPTLTFYLMETDNYGGITSGPRWLLWLTPLLLMLLPRPVAALGKSSAGRAFLVVIFLLSAFSALGVGLNPYSHPWLYELVAR